MEERLAELREVEEEQVRAPTFRPLSAFRAVQSRPACGGLTVASHLQERLIAAGEAVDVAYTQGQWGYIREEIVSGKLSPGHQTALEDGVVDRESLTYGAAARAGQGPRL